MLLWTDRADSLMYFLMYIYLAGTRGWRLFDLLSGANLVVGANASKKIFFGRFFICLSICYKKWQFYEPLNRAYVKKFRLFFRRLSVNSRSVTLIHRPWWRVARIFWILDTTPQTRSSRAWSASRTNGQTWKTWLAIARRRSRKIRSCNSLSLIIMISCRGWTWWKGLSPTMTLDMMRQAATHCWRNTRWVFILILNDCSRSTLLSWICSMCFPDCRLR